MPETFRDALAAYQRRLRLVAVTAALIVASAIACLLTVVLGLAGVPVTSVRTAAFAASALVATLLAGFWWNRLNTRRVAASIESRAPGLDNVVVTAEEILRGSRPPVHPVVREAVFREAALRLQNLELAARPSLLAPLLLGVGGVGAAVLMVIAAPIWPQTASTATSGSQRATVAPLEAGDLRVVITPPSYTGRKTSQSINPSEVVAFESSRIRFEAASEGGRVQLVEPLHAPTPFVFLNGHWIHEFEATHSRVLLIQRPDMGTDRDDDRLLQLRVVTDQRPIVRIRAPGKDLIFGKPAGHVPVEIEARDDLALASVALRYTRVAGSGETFTFQEGEAPVRIETTAAGEWRAHATLALDGLGLVEGDTLVYRAVATDRKPGADPAASDAFLIEIGRLSGQSSTGFAIPEDRERQAISQQMVIMKTERLNAERSTLSREVFEEQARLLAVEQRMVKAEFVFMTGGEVADEVEEAEHAHELVEGRFENVAQIELLTAIREMSRAEQRLNATDTAQALTFERNALRALQRAFDRRRYLLRSLPERTRIDLTRRLTGERTAARPHGRSASEAANVDPSITDARRLMRELATAIETRQSLNAALAARILAVEPTSEALQKIAVTLAAEESIDTRLSAARQAERQLGAIVRGRLAASPQFRMGGASLQGRFADEVARLRGQR